MCKNGWTEHDAIWAVDSDGPKEACIRWGYMGATCWIRLNHPCAAAMWPCVKLLWLVVLAVDIGNGRIECWAGWNRWTTERLTCTMADIGRHAATRALSTWACPSCGSRVYWWCVTLVLPVAQWTASSKTYYDRPRCIQMILLESRCFGCFWCQNCFHLKTWPACYVLQTADRHKHVSLATHAHVTCCSISEAFAVFRET